MNPFGTGNYSGSGRPAGKRLEVASTKHAKQG